MNSSMRLSFKAALFGFLMSSMVGCGGLPSGKAYHEAITDGSQAQAPVPVNPVPTPTPKPVTLGWTVVSDRVTSSCATCHGSTYSSKPNVKRNRAAISRVVNGNTMPPRRPLGVCPKAILKAWIQAGMPDSTTQPITTLAGCENENVQNIIDRWIEGQPDNSDF